MIRLQSPLRYPGSKSNLVDYLSAVVREKVGSPHVFFEPYAGGASMSLGMVAQGGASKAVLVERDPLLYAFWKCVIEQPEDLCEAIQDVVVSIATWKEFQVYLDPHALDKWDLLPLGLAGLFFNRANFSGIIRAKPIGGMSQASKYKIDCRFNKDRVIGSILDIAKRRESLEVHFGDAIEFMKQNRARLEDGFVYVDPPYFLTGKKLYRYSYTLEQHRELAKFLDVQAFPWVVSIDNHPEIRNLYSNQKVVPIFLSYVIKRSRRAEELLISNLYLREPVYDYPVYESEEAQLPLIQGLGRS